jgi:hypothetical protein
VKTAWGTVIGVLVGLNAAVAGSPFDVGSKAQLFVDQVLVRSSENVAFTLHPGKKHPKNPLVKADQPWEDWRLSLFGSVIYDAEEQIFKMWYIGEPSAYFPRYSTFYATSKDGITWEKPPVGTISSPKIDKHNAVLYSGILASVTKDNAEPDPARRYKMIGFLYRPNPVIGAATLVSPDGLHWTLLSKKIICESADVITGYYDTSRQLFVAFPKQMVKVLGHERRCFSVMTSKDFVQWTKPKVVIEPDLRDDAGSLARIEEVRPILDVPDDPKSMRTEFYGVSAYQAESCTIAFLWMLTINNAARNFEGHEPNQEGPGELQLAVSRDLEQWDRPFRTPCVERGKLGTWDCGFFEAAAQAIRVGDEVWLYYHGGNYTHGSPCLYAEKDVGGKDTGRKTKFTGSIGLATWKLDRFVSADAPAEGGKLTTVPIVFAGQRLEINATTKPGGSVTVEVLDLAGKVLARSQSFSGDEIRHRVVWQDDASLSNLAGKPIVLKFHLKSAELYSFAFRP